MMQCPSRPKDHIEWIRKEKFRLAPDGTIIEHNPLSDDLQRAIEQLSKGLYSKETHFILELIQNAEDNHYSENVKPDLTFLLLPKDPTGTPRAEGALIVINNERGFRPKDVKALCSVGDTTKTKRKGYIGEKGIGFKSVFAVSSQPHIFSAGYQFRFQEQLDYHTELGYIVPDWISKIPSEIEQHRNKTCILLPLKPGKQKDVTKELETIAPETLLFLSKLEGLTIQIGERKPIEVIRDDTNRPLVQFVTDDKLMEFWVTEEEVFIPSDIHEEKREDVDTRKVSVALPLTPEFEFKETIFAFLPTKVNSNFPFLINADFILSASREGIQFDRPWNRWLRDCVGPVFVQAFESLLDELEYRAIAYSFIPLTKDDQEEFFQPTIEFIHKELSNRAVVWTFGGKTLAKPAETRWTSRNFRNLLSPPQLPAQLQNTPLVHPKIQGYRTQLQAIGVKKLNSDEITECLRDESWLEDQSLEWFTELYEYFAQRSWATKERLQGLNLLPLEGGTRSNTAEQPVYYPEEDLQETRQLQNQASSVLDVAFLNQKTYELIRDDQELKRWLTDTLGVRELTLDNYCLDLAQALNAHRAKISVSEMVCLTAYIREQFDTLEDETKQTIKDTLPLVLAGEEIVEPQQWSESHPLAMPEAMDPETGWQLIFASPDDRAHIQVLSDAYLAGCEGKKERNAWRHFFRAIGATDAPLPRKQSWRFDSRYRIPENVPDHSREFLETNWRMSGRDYSLQDYIPPHWLQMLEETHQPNEKTEKRSFALLHWLERRSSQARGGNSILPQAQCEWYYYKWRSESLDSEFKYYIQNAPWFPSTQGLKKPSEVFLDRLELRELFSDALPYALKEPSEKLAGRLGLHQRATVDAFLLYLKELTSRPAEQVEQTVVHEFYAFLSKRWRAEIRQQFEKHPIILISDPKPRWVTADQAVWPDLSDVFGETYVYIETSYNHHFKEFFVEKVGVTEKLNPELFAKTWTRLAGTENAQADTVEAALEHIYPELLKVVKEDEQPSWWQKFCSNIKVWTQNDRFESPDRVYIPDDGELKRLFAEKNVEFAWRPTKAAFADYRVLYSALGVHSLVEKVQASAKVQEMAEADSFDPFLTMAAKKAICHYLWNKRDNEYERARQGSILGALLRTQEQLVNSLTVSYKLDVISVKVSNSGAYWQQDKCVLYRSKAHSKDRLEIEIPADLARRLAGGRPSTGLENFIARILGASEEKSRGIIRKHNWSLPNEEQVWMQDNLDSLLTKMGLGRLDIRSNPSNLTIYVDGKRKGQTPLSLPDLKANRHYVIRTELDGQVKKKRVFLLPEQTREVFFDFSLEPPPPPPTILRIDSSPQGARILIDGQCKGETPLGIEMDGDKSYIVKAELNGQTKSKRVRLVAEEKSLHFKFGMPPKPHPPGTLIIHSEPPGAKIWVNDTKYGKAPVNVSGLRGGSRPKVMAKLDRRQAIRRFSVPSDGTSFKVLIRIPEESSLSIPATLTVFSKPKGASIWINGSFQGQAPVTVEDLAGNAEHGIKAELADQRERENLWLAAGDNRKITIDMGEADPTTKEIERWAIEKYVIPYEKLNDRTARDVSEEDRGYDIYSEGNSTVRHIEIKSSRGELTQVTFTDNEWRKAQEHQDDYYLYVVTQVKQNPDDFVGYIVEYRNPYEQFHAIAQPTKRVEYVLALP